MKCLSGILLGCVLATQSFGQTARQGDQKSDPTEFHSPMVVEAPFIAADPGVWNLKKDSSVTSPEYGRLRRFHCDGVSIVGLQLVSSKDIPGDKIETEAHFSILNPGHDKFVKLLLELFNGDEKVAESSLGPFKVKEGALVQHSTKITPSKKDLKTDPMTTLRITMTNWDY